MNPIETNKLLRLGFQKSASTYTLDENKITYDGCYWWLNEEKIEDDIEKLKQKINARKDLPDLQ